MSFLPLDELDPTLTDVLAFIDDFQGSDSDQSSLTSSSSSDKEPLASPPDASSKRKKSRAAASRRFQQKKKAELLALRAQVSTLQTRLTELGANAAPRGGAVKTLDETQKKNLVALWLRKAALEKHLRLVAEAQNRQLKTALGRQKKAAKVVHHLLQSVTSVVHAEEGLRTPRPTAFVGGSFVPNLADAIYGELASRLGNLYLDADGVFAARDSLQTKFITDEVEIHWDPVSGVPYVELRASTPVNWSVRETATMVQKQKALEENQYRKFYKTQLGMRKESQIELRNQSMAMSVNVLGLSRIYEEKNRVLNVWTSLVCDHPLDTSVHFRDQGLVMISSSPSNQQQSLVQLCYRLTPEFDSGLSSSPASQDMNNMTLFVLQKLGSVMLQNFADMGSAFTSTKLQ